MNKKKVLLLTAVVAAIVLFFALDMGRFLTLATLQNSLAEVHQFYDQRPFTALALFFVVYVSVTALSLPGAAVMTLAAGAFFGLTVGTLLVSFASSIGATLAFLVARIILRDSIQRRFGDRLKAINEGVRRDGALYLFTLRLVPAFPFFMINVVMALTPIRTWTFYWVSQVGMFAGTIVYVNAGTQLAELDSMAGLLSPQLIGAFVLLGLFPWIAKAMVAVIQSGRVYKRWQKPEKFDANMIVIGAGSAGLVSAYIGAAVKANVVLIEREKMGGDCLNTGCVPSKALIKSARVNHLLGKADHFGIQGGLQGVDFPQVMNRIGQVIKKIEPHDSVERYTDLGVDVRQGNARLVSPWEVEITNGQGSQRITAKSIVIASGGEPMVPPIEGLDQVDYLTSDTLWSIEQQPERLLVLGGGPIGCELAQSFARLGSQVTLVEMADRLLTREDPEVSELLQQQMQADGVELLLGHKAVAFTKQADENTVLLEHQGEQKSVAFDQVLIALGRKARTQGMELDKIGVTLTERGTIEVDDFLRTRIPNIYACGDVAGPYQFTHAAAHQAWYVAVNALFGSLKKFRVDYSIIPWATFTSPEIAHVGLNEIEATEKNIPYEVTRYGIDDLDRAIADSVAEGFVKVLTKPGTDKILGVTLVGEHAGDLIAEYVLAMRHGLGLNKILGTIHIYPTLAEANKFAAGEWKKAHAPQGLLAWVAKFHRWRLS